MSSITSLTTESGLTDKGKTSSGFDGIVFVFASIVGITVGIIVLTLLIILMVHCCKRRRRKLDSGQNMVTITRQPHQHVDRPRNTEHLYAEAVEPSAPPLEVTSVVTTDGGYTNVPPAYQEVDHGGYSNTRPPSPRIDEGGYSNVPPPYPGV